MVDSIMYQQDGYVVLETNQEEQLMTESELRSKLEILLATQSDLPTDITKFNTLSQQAEYLLNNYCEFNIDDDHYLQWYVVRWNTQ